MKFIFKSTDHPFIDSLPMSNRLRGFAQGLLVEVIDASYAIGFVHVLIKSATNPVKGAIKILKSFGRKASKHWFKHASVHDLQNIQVYDFIRNEVVRAFRKPFLLWLTKNELDKKSGAFLAYKIPSHGIIKRWG